MEEVRWLMEEVRWMMEEVRWLMEEVRWMMEEVRWMMEDVRWMLEAAADLRYLVESPEELVAALMTLDCVRQISQERGMKEIEDAAEGAWTGPRYKRIPQRVQKVLIRAGVDDTQDAPTGKGKVEDEERERQMNALRVFAQRIKPLLAPPYDTVCEGVEDENLLSHIFAAGTMFCTLMTRCTYTHYDGKEHRMNPQALIIAPPASGKSTCSTRSWPRPTRPTAVPTGLASATWS